MEKRYQVFISSTFADLKEERSAVQQAVMELDCFPAGMELFPAIDEDQFDFIKKVIDDCDYYLLIIGGRYGSLTPEGVSYTEMEYKYAVSKGLRVIAFLHKDPDSIPAGKSEKDAKARRKLAAFRDEASNGRLVKYWVDAKELPGLTLASLGRTIRTYPAVGWVRGDNAADPALYKEIADLRKENQELKEAGVKQGKIPSIAYNLAGLDDAITVHGEAQLSTGSGTRSGESWEVTITWGELFGILGPDLYEPIKDSVIAQRIPYKIVDKSNSNLREKGLISSTINQSDFQTIKIQFKALGLINLYTKESGLLWSLTEFGEQELISLRAIKKAVSTTE